MILRAEKKQDSGGPVLCNASWCLALTFGVFEDSMCQSAAARVPPRPQPALLLHQRRLLTLLMRVSEMQEILSRRRLQDPSPSGAESALQADPQPRNLSSGSTGYTGCAPLSSSAALTKQTFSSRTVGAPTARVFVTF